MSKRSAPSSPTEEHSETKRPKLPDTQEATSPPPETVNNTPSPLIENIHGDLLQSEPPVKPDDKPVATKEKKNKKETKRKAGDGFASWKPKPAYIDIPELQPHWGIVPRPGTYEKPSHPQPSARTSEGAIRPALWEDRKGAVRLKRGSRYINGYDQAFHMWLPLMDVRPISSKDQKPRRMPVGYYYPHGMPIDWNDTGALNDVNKALQEAIKSKSNKEAPFNQVERGILAEIFSENPDISMLDAAEQFNERAYPITAPESGRYPSGRFTESIQHEFRIYQSSYVKGQAPTEATEKDIPLEKLYAEWKGEQVKAKAATKKVATLKVPKKPKKSSSGKSSKATGDIKKKGKSRKVRKTDEELAAGADATYAEIMAKEAAEEAEKAAAERVRAGTEYKAAEPPINVSEQPSDGSIKSQAVKLTETLAVTDQGAVAASTHEVISENEVATASSEAHSAFAERAIRSVEIDENYDVEEEIL